MCSQKKKEQRKKKKKEKRKKKKEKRKKKRKEKKRKEKKRKEKKKESRQQCQVNGHVCCHNSVQNVPWLGAYVFDLDAFVWVHDQHFVEQITGLV